MKNFIHIFNFILMPFIFITKKFILHKVTFQHHNPLGGRWVPSIVTLAFLLLTPIQIQAVDIWTEDFSGQDGKGATGSSIDTTGVNWTIDVSGTTLSNSNDWFRVENEAFDGRDLDGVAIWESPTIDTSAYNNISFSLDTSKSGGSMESTDYVGVYYSINGGSFTETITLNDDFPAQSVNQSIGTATSLKIRVIMRNNGSQERYNFDNVSVTGDTGTASYSCPGEDVEFINGATGDAYKEYSTGEDIAENARYFKFQTAVDGEITIHQQNNKPVGGYWNHELRVGTSCDGTQVYDGPNSSNDSVTFNVSAGTTYYVRVQERNNQNVLNFDISFDFTVVTNEADLTITKSVDNSTPTVGDTVTFTIVGTNNGPTTTDIEIIDTLPSGFTATNISENKNSFSCSQSGNTITCDGNQNFDQGESVTIIVEGSVSTAGTYTNTATITSTESISDPDNTNNTSNATITASDSDPDPGGGGTEPSECPLGAHEAFREFCLRKKITVPGNMVTVGNTILVAPTTQNSNPCGTYKNESYISDATEANNHYYLCEYWDDPARPSTSATIDSSHIPDPTHSSVEWAGLYWQALVDDSESVTNMRIKIKNGNDSYEEVGYDKLDWGDGVGKNGYISYSAFKDVTAVLNNNNWLDGKYTVADIPVEEGKIETLGSYGAWTLVIIYRNDKEKLRNFSIFDGWRRLQDTSGNREALINASGFYTPKQEPISSTVSVFTAEGDKRITDDYLYAKNANNSDTFETLTYTSGHTFNSSIVPSDFTRTPNPVNNQGIDIQTFQLGTDGENFLETTQSSIDFKFTTNQDTYFPSMIAFNTELYAPELCYDYAYKQYGVYFTEDNNGSFDPYIIGDGLSTSEDIVVELFIRNDEESDTDATNMTVHITDINASQATYVPNSALVTLPGGVFPQPATPNPLQDIFIGTVGGKEYFSIDYNLDLVGSSINMPIKVELEYTLNLADSSGNSVPIDFKTVLNENVPLCTEDNFAYYPDYSIFNVENSVLSASQKYNLPTQTANRAGDFKIVSYDKDAVHTRKGVSMPVAVDLIDADKYHDIKASCAEPDSALTPRVWVMFENNATIVDFDKSVIDTAIAQGRVSDQILNLNNPITDAEGYYNIVRENTAFRVMYNLTDTGTDIRLVPDACQAQQVAPCYRVEGFSDLPGLDVGNGPGNCGQDIDGNLNSTDKIPQYCGNAGAKGLDSEHLAECMECIYGGNTRFICSRDNFAIRPESFRVQIKDQNQNDTTQQSFIATNDTPSKSHSSGNGDRIVAGYNYHVEINATNHQNDNATPGYYTSFTGDGMDGQRVFSLKWWDFTNDSTYCNDISDHNKTTTFHNGYADLNLSNNQIGKYDLNLFDKLWTRVDWDSDYRSHHVTNAAYFANGSDCRDNSSFVPVQNSLTASYLDDMSGCDVNTASHTNSNNSLEYTDMPLYIFPYEFDHSGVIPDIGPYSRTNGQTFVYIDTPPTMDANDTEMSYNMNGTFAAVGYNNVRLSNFVTQCYAADVDMDLLFTYNIPEPPITPYLSYSLKDHNTTDGTIIYRPASGIDNFEVAEHDSINTPFSIIQGEEFFAKDMGGSMTMDLGYNFARTYNQPLNPRFITFNDFNITYNINPTGVKADLVSDFKIFGNKDLDDNVTFVYGRAKPSQYFYDDVVENSIDTPNSIVVYCDQDPITCSVVYNIENAALRKTEEFDWYLSQGHVTTDNDGNITLVASTGGDVTNDDPVAINNSGGVNNPDVNVSVTVTTRPLDVFIDFRNDTNRWLIYNPYLNAIPSPYYRVRFIGESDWAGAGDTGHTVGGKSNIQKNRRLGW